MAEIVQGKEYLVPTAGKEYVKNPFSLVTLNGNFSLTQQRIMMTIVQKLQVRIKDYLDNIAARKANAQYGLFKDQEFDEDQKVKIRIKLNEVMDYACDYRHLEEASKAMSTIFVQVQKHDDDGTLLSGFAPLMSCFIPVSDKRRTGNLVVEIEKAVANSIFNMRAGYAEHIRKIVQLCKCSRSPKLYEFLSAKFRWANVYEMPYQDLRRLIGATILDSEGKVVEEKYRLYRDVRLRILDPVRDELRALWENTNETDFCFEYEPIYNGNRKRGNPDAIRFILVKDKAVEVIDDKQSQTPAHNSAVIGRWQEYLRRAAEVVGAQVVDEWSQAVDVSAPDDKTLFLFFEYSTTLELFDKFLFTPTQAIFQEIMTGINWRKEIKR